jgi:hypothetical protein
MYTIDVRHAMHLLGQFTGASLEGVGVGGAGEHVHSQSAKYWIPVGKIFSHLEKMNYIEKLKYRSETD